MGGFYGLTSKYRHRGMRRRKIALALSVLLVCVNIGLSGFSIHARADEPVPGRNSVSGNEVSGNSSAPSIEVPEAAVSDNVPGVSDNTVSGNDPEINPDPEGVIEEEPVVSGNDDPAGEPEEDPGEEPVEETPAEESHVQPEEISNTNYEAVAYQEIAEYFLEPRIARVDRDADYVGGIYYAYPHGCYYFFLENEISYLVCRYDGGQDYIFVKNGQAVWSIPEDLAGKVSFGYEGTEGTYRELFSEVIYHDTTAPAVILGMDETYQAQLRVEISEVGAAKSGIAEISCTVDGQIVSLDNYAEVQKGSWKGRGVALMSLGTLQETAGVHEVTVRATDLCGNVSETTHSVEFLTNGLISVTLPSTFILPMLYDGNDGKYVIMENELNVINNGDCPLDVKITNVTVSVDKSLPEGWKGADPSSALAAASRKSVDTTMTVESRQSGRSSMRLKEGLNSDGMSFVLDAKKDGETGNVATISFEGFTGQGDPYIWESGDFVVHMTFMFSLHLEPKAETVIVSEETPLAAAPALRPEDNDPEQDTSAGEAALAELSASASDNDILSEAVPAEGPPETPSGGDSDLYGESAPKNESPEAL